MKYPASIWQALVAEVGASCVFLDDETLNSHSYDVWPVAAKWRLQGKSPHRPQAVVRPNNAEQISRLLHWANLHGVPVTPWGLGSSVTGASLPLHGGVCLDLSTLDRILALDETNLLVKVQAGITGLKLEQELNAHGYTLNHSPQSLDRSTPGGWVSTLAAGQFSTRYGGIDELTVALEIVLPGGEIVSTILAPRAAVGPDLKHLFLGAEGTLGVITAVTMKIFPLPEARLFDTVAFERLEPGLEAMRQIMRCGLRPFLARYYDPDESRFAMQNPAFSGCALFLGFEGPAAVTRAEHAVALEILNAEGGRLLGPEPVRTWMQRRFDFSAIEDRLEKPGGLAETIEVAHFWNEILPLYEALKSSLAPYADEVLGHFSHTYPQGTSLYLILLGQASDDSEAEKRILRIWEIAMETCLEKGAAISHHHGIGIARLPYIQRQLGTSFSILEKLKSTLDPAGIMNPGKLGLSSPGVYD
jgi:alkyldihydroxyacetonephosphate synthase